MQFIQFIHFHAIRTFSKHILVVHKPNIIRTWYKLSYESMPNCITRTVLLYFEVVTKAPVDKKGFCTRYRQCKRQRVRTKNGVPSITVVLFEFDIPTLSYQEIPRYNAWMEGTEVTKHTLARFGCFVRRLTRDPFLGTCGFWCLGYREIPW